MLALLFTGTDLRNKAGQTFVLPAHPITVGRRPECDLVFVDRTVSGRHATITPQGGQGLVIDLNSTNGTLINGKRVSEGRVVPGDKIHFGQFEVQVLALKGRGAAEEAEVLATRAQLMVLQGSTAGRILEIDKPIWKLGSNGGPQLVFVRRPTGWSVTLLDGVGTLKINGAEVTHMPMPLNNQDHIVYEGKAFQFKYA
jgi:pSer/pThr/pTyr-binding forkhead associated (FHA) protein